MEGGFLFPFIEDLWKDWNPEFLESFHLIEGSLYEVDENKRIALLDKALQVMLDSTYDNMLHYAHNLNSPITILHMLCIILPILGLIIFPLIGAFLGGLVKWYHLFFLYNLILPILVYLYGNSLRILLRMPQLTPSCISWDQALYIFSPLLFPGRYHTARGSQIP